MAKQLLVVLDGLQDSAYLEIGNKTPYQAGKGKNLSFLESRSAIGRLHTTPEGFEPDTQTCILRLLGVPVRAIPHGRSYIEALALGLDMGTQDLILRCNFVAVDSQGRLEVPCCPAPPQIAEELREAVRAYGYGLYPVGSYKSLQVIPGGARYLDSLRTAAPHQHKDEPLELLLPRGNELGEKLAALSRGLLERHSPYTVFNWAQSGRVSLPSFEELHGLTGALITKTHAPQGIARAMGMCCPELPTATGDTDTDIPAKVNAALSRLEDCDFVLLHIGGTDEATHRQNPVEKAEFLQKLDRELFGPVLEAMATGDRLMVASDHAALCSTAGHTADPVFFLLYEQGGTPGGEIGLWEGDMAVELLCRGASGGQRFRR